MLLYFRSYCIYFFKIENKKKKLRIVFIFRFVQHRIFQKKVKLLLPIADKKGFRKGVDHATLNSPKNVKLLLLIGYKKGSRKGVWGFLFISSPAVTDSWQERSLRQKGGRFVFFPHKQELRNAYQNIRGNLWNLSCPEIWIENE